VEKKVINIPKEELPVENKKDQEVTITYENNNKNLDLEEYVIGVVACEMPASFEIEALKALSVAARTFALYKISKDKDYVLKTTTSDQCYNSIEDMKKKWGTNFDIYYSKIKEAVTYTENQIMTYNDEIIIAFYFSTSNGYTENVENVFSQKLNYLVSVNSEWDKEYNYKEDVKKVSYEEFNKALNITNISLKDIKIDRTDTNRVNKITIKDKSYKGTEFRKIFNLKSTDFYITLGDNVEIYTKGYGHGVGMSEYGANVMAKKGYKYEEILKYYYSGIKIVNNY
jgi:stage II sporulation protein D